MREQPLDRLSDVALWRKDDTSTAGAGFEQRLEETFVGPLLLRRFSDLYAFIGTLIAGVVIVTTGFHRADPIASLLVAAMMLKAAYGLLKDSGRVLFEMAPEQLNVQEIGDALATHPHVASVHDLHVWEIGSDFPSLSAAHARSQGRRLPRDPPRTRAAPR